MALTQPIKPQVQDCEEIVSGLHKEKSKIVREHITPTGVSVKELQSQYNRLVKEKKRYISDQLIRVDKRKILSQSNEIIANEEIND